MPVRYDFDPDQPRLPKSVFRNWQTYVGLRGSSDKLKTLIRSNEFTDICECDDNIDCDKTPIFDYTLLVKRN